jgi:signal transduction histidine kinase
VIVPVRSLQLQLALRLALLYLAVMAAGVAALVYQAYATADSLSDRELARRADELAARVSFDATGKLRLRLPPVLEDLYHAVAETRIFAVRDQADTLIASSHPHVAELVAKWPRFADQPDHFRLEEFGTFQQDYYGLAEMLDSPVGRISVMVARATDSDGLVHSIVEEILYDLAWILPALVAATLLVGIYALRRGLRPLREASARAAAIGPGTISVRLPQDNLPTELLPLVAAVNRALDRLEHGFAAQRAFTANAAHELRTPLAIVTAGLEALPPSEPVDKVRADVGRMNRLVDQLLHAARLDSVAPDVTTRVDLHEIASDVVGYMAPWAVAQDRMLALDGKEDRVVVCGNAGAIADALRNLIENAINAAPRGSEVTVRVGDDGSVTVADHGPGIPNDYRPHIFERFWRGQSARSSGAGLGLAIVAEIMRLHGGRIEVDDNAGGGAVFRLQFRTAV